MSIRLKPAGERIMVIRIPDEEKTVGGILIPETSRQKPMEAEIVAIGPGRKLDSGETYRPDFSLGDHVLMGMYAGCDITLDSVTYTLIREDEILGIITPKVAS